MVGCEEGDGSWIPDSRFEGLFSAGEDMSADGRRQLALFLVSSGGVRGRSLEGAYAGLRHGLRKVLASTHSAFLQARKHLLNFEATHCTPLPAQHFQMPWHL